MQHVEFEGKTYQVSLDAMPNQLKKQLPEKAMGQYLHLLEEVQKQPRKVYQQIQDFGKEYEDVPEVINLLTFAHIQNHRIVEAENLIKETYERHPEYFFARINYADQCIRKKELSRMPEIFPSFDLAQLCPERNTFHTSEFRGFLIMAAYYHRAIKQLEKAKAYYEKAKEVQPDHPSVIYLGKKLYKRPLLRRLFRKQ